jgi:hypothetical protein
MLVFSSGLDGGLLHTTPFVPHWLVGRSAVAGLQLCGSERQLVQCQPERPGDTVGDMPGGVSDAALKPADGGSVEICGVG